MVLGLPGKGGEEGKIEKVRGRGLLSLSRLLLCSITLKWFFMIPTNLVFDGRGLRLSFRCLLSFRQTLTEDMEEWNERVLIKQALLLVNGTAPFN